MEKHLRVRAIEFYSNHETKVDIGFFLSGFVFDIFTLSAVDDLFSVVQQVLYLALLGLIFVLEFFTESKVWSIPQRFQKWWEHRSFAIHFLLGSLLSIYSLFFLKSSSAISSLFFVVLLMLVMVANESKFIQRRGLDTKISLFVVCLFCFFSMLTPVMVGFIGWIPNLLAFFATALVMVGIWYLIKNRVSPQADLQKRLLIPSGIVFVLFIVFHLFGWIPPVPLAVEEMGIYHKVTKNDGIYYLSHSKAWWRIWDNGDQDFKARDGDKIYVFVRIFSPAKFADKVYLRWEMKDPNQGWIQSDRIPMGITGGRDGGYRGHAYKSNYQIGTWRVLVETADGREVGRIPFYVSRDESLEEREFQVIER